MSEDTSDDDTVHDNGVVWGFMSGDTFVPLPKRPLLLAGLGPAPFSVVLPSGQTRHVINAPDKT